MVPMALNAPHRDRRESAHTHRRDGRNDHRGDNQKCRDIQVAGFNGQHRAVALNLIGNIAAAGEQDANNRSHPIRLITQATR